MKGNSYEMMRLIQSVQKVKQVDNRKMHVDDIREYAKQLSISIVNSQKNLKKIPNKQPQPQLSEVKKVPINLVEQKKPDYVKPEMFKTKEVVKPKEVVKEVVKEVPKTNKGAPSKVPPLPKGAVPPVPLGLLPPVAKPKDTTTNTTNNTNINKFNTNTNTNTNNTTNNTINTNNTNNTNNINLNPTHNTQNNNTTTTTHTSENNHHQDNEETQEKKPFQPTLPVKKDMAQELKDKMEKMTTQRQSAFVDGKFVLPTTNKQDNKPVFSVQLKKLPSKDVNIDVKPEEVKPQDSSSTNVTTVTTNTTTNTTANVISNPIIEKQVVQIPKSEPIIENKKEEPKSDFKSKMAAFNSKPSVTNIDTKPQPLPLCNYFY